MDKHEDSTPTTQPYAPPAIERREPLTALASIRNSQPCAAC
jgi:hypothetical protein